MKVSRHKIRVFICAFAGILSMNPYFVWETFFNGILAYFTYIFYSLAILILLKYGMKRRIRTNGLITMGLMLIIYCVTYLHSYSGVGIKNVISGALLFTFLTCFVLTESQLRCEIFEMYTKLFIISMIPGLVYYVLELFGVSLSIDTIRSNNQILYDQSKDFESLGVSGYYKVYLGAVMRVNSNTRFAGIYDEAGLVGTVCALLLAARGWKMKKNTLNKWLILFLLLSFSLAGYILGLVYFIIKFIRQQQWKLLLILVCCSIGLMVLLNISTDISTINNLQNRFVVNKGMIFIVNNRETSNYMKGFSQYLNSNLGTKMFGYGRGASVANYLMNGSSSYRNLLYNFGIVGVLSMMYMLIHSYFSNIRWKIKNNWSAVVLFLLFIISMYQRPGVFFPFYFIILYGGQAFIGRKREMSNASN